MSQLFISPSVWLCFRISFIRPTSDALTRIILRWAHFVAGITWIGLLYFFNLVNVPVQKALDPDTKKKVNPDLLGRALWYFRWGAVVTVLAGLAYFAMYILKADVTNANTIGGGNINLWWVLFAWLTYPIVLFIVEFLIIKKVPALIKDGRVFAVVMFILVAIVSWGLVKFFDGDAHCRGRELCQQQDILDRHRRRLRHRDDAKRLGHHLAQQQTHSCRDCGHWSRGAAGIGAPGIHRFANKHLVVAAAVALHGHVARRLGDLR